MKKTELVGLIAAPLMVFALALPACGGFDPDHLQGRHHLHVHRQGHLQRPRRRAEGRNLGGLRCPRCGGASRGPAAPAAPAASGATSTCKDGTTSTSTGKGTCSGHGGVQKARRQACAAPRLRRRRRAPRLRPGRRQVRDRCEVGTHCDGQQYRSDRCDGQVQGRHLLEVAAPQRYLLQSRRRRRVVDA